MTDKVVLLSRVEKHCCEWEGPDVPHGCSRSGSWQLIKNRLYCHRHKRIMMERVGWDANDFSRAIWNGE